MHKKSSYHPILFQSPLIFTLSKVFKDDFESTRLRTLTSENRKRHNVEQYQPACQRCPSDPWISNAVEKGKKKGGTQDSSSSSFLQTVF